MKLPYFIFLHSVLIFLTISASGAGNDEVLTKPLGYFDLQQNTKSNIEFYTTNYGDFGLNALQNRGGCIWPRGSQNMYIFGSGFFFGAVKKRPNDTILKKYVEVSYNPNNGNSWMVPGRIEDCDTALAKDTKTYRIYLSRDFDKQSGSPFNSEDGPSWPVWKKENQFGNYSDFYVHDTLKRNKTQYPLGPSFVSDEDIFSTYKDTDLRWYDGGATLRKYDGYPLGLQYEQTIYSWADSIRKDMLILSYRIINFSKDTLLNCWFAPVYDTDLARLTNPSEGARNDGASYYFQDSTLNLCYCWTDTNKGETGYGFGYLGISFLESPSVYRYDRLKADLRKFPRDSIYNYEINGIRHTEYFCCTDAHREPNSKNLNDTIHVCDKYVLVKKERVNIDSTVEVIYDISKFLRNDKDFYEDYDQIGMRTFRIWTILVDYNRDDERYNFLSAGIKDHRLPNPSDIRILIATGPFHLKPTDTVDIKVLLFFAKPALGSETNPDDTSDLKNLKDIVIFAKDYFKTNKLISAIEPTNSSGYDKGASFDIFPNPTSDYISIVGANSRLPQQDIQIYNTIGECVLLVVGINCFLPLRVDIKGLPAGVYNLRIGNRSKMFVKY